MPKPVKPKIPAAKLLKPRVDTENHDVGRVSERPPVPPRLRPTTAAWKTNLVFVFF